jgi:hypothetical protein
MPVRSWEEGGLLRVRRGHGDVEGLVESQVEAVEASTKRCERVDVWTCGRVNHVAECGLSRERDKRDRVVPGGHRMSGSEPRRN